MDLKKKKPFDKPQKSWKLTLVAGPGLSWSTSRLHLLVCNPSTVLFLRRLASEATLPPSLEEKPDPGTQTSARGTNVFWLPGILDLFCTALRYPDLFHSAPASAAPLVRTEPNLCSSHLTTLTSAPGPQPRG